MIRVHRRIDIDSKARRPFKAHRPWRYMYLKWFSRGEVSVRAQWMKGQLYILVEECEPGWTGCVYWVWYHELGEKASRRHTTKEEALRFFGEWEDK